MNGKSFQSKEGMPLLPQNTDPGPRSDYNRQNKNAVLSPRCGTCECCLKRKRDLCRRNHLEDSERWTYMSLARCTRKTVRMSLQKGYKGVWHRRQEEGDVETRLMQPEAQECWQLGEAVGRMRFSPTLASKSMTPFKTWFLSSVPHFVLLFRTMQKATTFVASSYIWLMAVRAASGS